MDRLLDRVRALHAPALEPYGGLVCRGCDSDGHFPEWPVWPCRTAEIVYSPEEVAELGKPKRVSTNSKTPGP